MNKISLLTAVGLSGLVLAPAAAAQEQYAWARVLDVQPITRVVRTEVPHRECRTEQVTRQGSGANPTGAMLAGALIGGVVGNQIGSGGGRRAATAAGVLIGSGMGHSSAVNTPRTAVEERCEVYTEIREDERFDGYRVSYEYGGAAVTEGAAQHPGDRIRVQVSVRPASF